MQKITKYKIYFFINFIIGMGIVYGYQYFQNSLYSAKSSIIVGTPNSSDMRVETQVELLKSTYLISKALKDIDLSHIYYQKINYKNHLLYNKSPFVVSLTRGYNIKFSLHHINSTTYQLITDNYSQIHTYGDKINNQNFNLTISRRDNILFEGFDYSFIIYSQHNLINRIKKSLSVNRLSNSSIIEVIYQNESPDRAKNFVIALVKSSVKESRKNNLREPISIATLKLKIDDNGTDDNSTKEIETLPKKIISPFSNNIVDLPYDATPVKIDYILYLVVVFIFAILMTILMYLLRFHKKEEEKDFKYIKDELDCIVLGSIPNITEHIEDDGSATVSLLVTDSFKELRDNLQFVSTDPTSQVISILSDSKIDDVSKSDIISNLGNSITYGGQRVVILDLNMQYPSIDKKFSLFNDDGMSTVLSHRAMIAKVVRYTENENLDVVTAGKYPPNPWQLIDSQRMIEVIDKLRNVYDVIILNMPKLKSEKLNILDISDVNIYILDKDSINNKKIDEVDKLNSQVKNFSVLFYNTN